jgi:addiction module RelE/StbE family toxin
MIKIEFHTRFQKNYKKRIQSNKKLDKLFRKRTQQFCINPNSALLNNHQLVGKMKGLYSFSIGGDNRVIYQWKDKNIVLFLDIGSHNQVY